MAHHSSDIERGGRPGRRSKGTVPSASGFRCWLARLLPHALLAPATGAQPA